MLKVGLTGGIGSGKTTVARIFSVLGIPVFDADENAKRIMHEDEELKEKLIEHFGESVFANDILDRKYLSEIVFKDEEKLKLLNSFVHPATIQAAEKWMMKQTAPYAIKEAALIFEAGAGEGLDYIIGVFAPHNLRIERVIKRQNLKREEVVSRMKNQIDDEVKKRLCDFVIINDEEQLIIPQVLEIHSKLLSIAKH